MTVHGVRRAVFVAGVERVVGAFHEYLAPLNETRRGESREGAKDEFLEERRLHRESLEHLKCHLIRASDAVTLRPGALRTRRATALLRPGLPLISPKTPLPGLHNPEAEKPICERVRKHARCEAACPICDRVVKRAGEKCGGPVRPRVTQRKSNGDDDERKPAELPKRHALEPFVNDKTQQKRAPEYFLNEWNHDDQSYKPQQDGEPVEGAIASQSGIEAVRPRGESEELLRRNPDDENHDGNEESERDIFGTSQVIAAPEPKQQRAAENGLRRENPELGVTQRESGSQFWQPLTDGQQSDEQCHRQHVRE